MVAIAVVAVVVGIAMAALWAQILLTGTSPEGREGRRSIRFHIAAEYLTAALLIAGGVGILVADGGVARALTGVGLGAALYSTVNSPGYYADLGRWPPVVMFLVLAAVVAATAAALVRVA